jgi:hypothetical protein
MFLSHHGADEPERPVGLGWGCPFPCTHLRCYPTRTETMFRQAEWATSGQSHTAGLRLIVPSTLAAFRFLPAHRRRNSMTSSTERSNAGMRRMFQNRVPLPASSARRCASKCASCRSMRTGTGRRSDSIGIAPRTASSRPCLTARSPSPLRSSSVVRDMPPRIERLVHAHQASFRAVVRRLMYESRCCDGQ